MSAAHRTDCPIGLMCRVLSVSRAGFDAARAMTDTFARCHRRYGAPRIHRARRAVNARISDERVARLMRSAGLTARSGRRCEATRDSRHALPLADNVVGRNFAMGGPVNTVWVSDTTSIPKREGWLHLAVVTDLASRFVVGWTTHAQNDTTLVLAALQRAVAMRQPRGDAVHHADRGSTYASHDYRAALTARGMTTSMSRKRNCWDNAVAESFFATVDGNCSRLATLRPGRWPRAQVPFIQE